MSLAIYYKRTRVNNILWMIDELEEPWRRKQGTFEANRFSLREDIERYKVQSTQKYKGTTVVHEYEPLQQQEEYLPSDRHAIITMVGSVYWENAYWLGALVVAQSLREVNTRVPNIIVMVRGHSELPSFAVDAFKRLDVQLVNIEAIYKNDSVARMPGTWGKKIVRYFLFLLRLCALCRSRWSPYH